MRAATDAATGTVTGALTGVEVPTAIMGNQRSSIIMVEPSAKVARRIGMRELGVLVDPWYGTDEDSYSRMFVARPDMFER